MKHDALHSSARSRIEAKQLDGFGMRPVDSPVLQMQDSQGSESLGQQDTPEGAEKHAPPQLIIGEFECSDK